MGVVAFGITCFVLAMVSGITTPAWVGSHPPAVIATVSCMLVVVAVVPVGLAMGAAGVSSTCASLEEDLNAICAEDPSFSRGMNFLRSMKAQNKDQGL